MTLSHPHNPQPVEKRGTQFVHKAVAGALTPPDPQSCLTSNEPKIGGLLVTLGRPMTAGQDLEIHKSADSGLPVHKPSTSFGAGSIHPQSAVHTPVPHELRRAWHTTKQLAEQLEVADLPVLHRIVLYVREQVLLELMKVEGYVEVDP